MTEIFSHPLVSLVLILVSIFIAIKSADYLVEGASSIAKSTGLSDLSIGLTIVAFGSSLPELFITLGASFFYMVDPEAYASSPGISMGTIIGSNNFNTMFVLGIAGFIHPLNCKKPAVWREIPISMAITILFYILVNDQMLFGRETNRLATVDAILLLVGFFVFFYFLFKNSQQEENTREAFPILNVMSAGKAYTYILISIVGLTVATVLIMFNINSIGKAANLSPEFLGLTLLAFGTSLPELSTAAVASFRRKADFAMGGVIGSNIFNLLFILPLGALIKPIPFNAKLDFDLYVLMGGTALLFLSMFTGKKKKLDQWEAFLLLAGFFAYIIYIIFRDTTPGINS
jgi:cation:H+ antiporter